MSRTGSTVLAALLAAAFAAGCETGEERVLAIDATGTIVGLVFVDRDGDENLNPAVDGPVQDVRLLLLRGARDTVARATSNAQGTYTMNGVPVGRYRLLVDSASVADTLRIIRGDTSGLTVSAGDTAGYVVTMSFPRATVAEARQFATGKRVLLEGVALNPWATFGDSTVHLADETGAIRVTRARESVFAAGDSVRVIGTLAVRDGRPTVNDATIILLRAAAELPDPEPITAAVAASADDARLDAAQVRVAGATILQVEVTTAGDLRITADDGSGSLEVLIDRDTGIPFTPYVPGAVLDATGLLVPAQSGGPWRLKPRFVTDLDVSFPSLTIAEARAETVGKRVFIEGKALNGWSTFGDSTLHIVDPTGTIRTTRVQEASILAGDSLRLLGRVSVRDGQPVLTDVTPFRLGTSELAPPTPLSTRNAARADDGRLDAALVSVDSANILGRTTTVTGDVLLTVDDGSGSLEVLLDRDAGINTAPYVPGAILTATGVLVPVQGGARWQLKPRFNNDLSHTFPQVTIAEARTLPIGKIVIIEGIALNGWATFGDLSVHFADTTGALRATSVANASLFAGDSIRMQGTIAIRDGQTVLNNVLPSVLRQGVGLPAAIEVSAEDAADADNGRLDAAQVRVRNLTITEAVTTAFGDRLITAEDPDSASMRILIDRDTGIPFSPYSVGTVIDATGVLVPVSGESRWILKPRVAADLVIQ